MRVAISDLVVDRGGFRAVDGVSLSLDGGAWMGLVGANGSGKTSLLRAITGRLEAQGGSILVDGEERIADRGWRARAFGFAPDPSALPAALTGRQLFSILGSDATGLGHGDPLRGVRAALDFEAFLDRRIATLSAGMRQRLALFCAFLNRPRAVILDEPFNWLDPICAFDTREALKALVAAEGLALLTALHDMATLIGYCDRGLLLSEGRVALRLGAEEIRAAAGDYPAFEAKVIAGLRSAKPPT
jgi:ABC-type multidrug transport system ATPase subunit